MGFDLIGGKKDDEKGGYFRNDGYWWRTLWGYVYDNCKDFITKEDLRKGLFNDGHYIDRDKAIRIAIRLEHLLNQGEVREDAKAFYDYIDNLPNEICLFCKGTGMSECQSKCHVCEGTGETNPRKDGYPFSEDNVRKFIEFSRNSGGFEIW